MAARPLTIGILAILTTLAVGRATAAGPAFAAEPLDPATTGTSAQAAASYSVMAFNVLYRGANEEKNLQAIADTQPDILCLRELVPGFAGRFAQRLKDDYPHRRYRRYPPRPAWGVGIASKFPITEWRVFRERPYTIPAADALVTIGGTEVRVVCVHLIPPMARYSRGQPAWETIERNRDLRRRQAKYLSFRYRDERRPVLMLGDFNEDVDEPALDFLDEQGFKNSCAIEADRCQDTWPAVTVFPAAFRFDHILGRNLSFVSSRVVEQGGSDHYPVLAEFTLPPPNATVSSGQ